MTSQLHNAYAKRATPLHVGLWPAFYLFSYNYASFTVVIMSPSRSTTLSE